MWRTVIRPRLTHSRRNWDHHLCYFSLQSSANRRRVLEVVWKQSADAKHNKKDLPFQSSERSIKTTCLVPGVLGTSRLILERSTLLEATAEKSGDSRAN